MYLMALLPAIGGLIYYFCSKRIVWLEWLGCVILGLATSATCHMIAICGMTADIETWSGVVTQAEHHPEWVEEYRQAHTRTWTTGSGKNRQTHTETYYTTEHDTHPEHWEEHLDFGETSEQKEISLARFNDVRQKFGGKVVDGGKQDTHHGGHFDGGDNNIYAVRNMTGHVFPVTTIRHFENRIKAAPTVFSFAKVPTNVPVYNWPENPNYQQSDRLIGEPRISSLEFDRFNSRLGPRKKVNVIMINFGLKDSSMSEWQKAKWVGGKKNDLVVCYGRVNSDGIAGWAKAFGWSESEGCKRNIESIMLGKQVNNDLLPILEREIAQNYKKKDWHKFDYITIEPPSWAYMALAIVMCLTQAGYWFWASMNEFGKEPKKQRFLY